MYACKLLIANWFLITVLTLSNSKFKKKKMQKVENKILNVWYTIYVNVF